MTETVYALGLQDLLVGDTDYCDYPPDAQKKQKVGGAINPSLEEIAHLKPDVVLVTRHLNSLDTVHSLDALGIASYATDPRNIDEIVASSKRLAEVLGAPERGVAIAEDLRSDWMCCGKKWDACRRAACYSSCGRIRLFPSGKIRLYFCCCRAAIYISDRYCVLAYIQCYRFCDHFRYPIDMCIYRSPVAVTIPLPSLLPVLAAKSAFASRVRAGGENTVMTEVAICPAASVMVNL